MGWNGGSGLALSAESVVDIYLDTSSVIFICGYPFISLKCVGDNPHRFADEDSILVVSSPRDSGGTGRVTKDVEHCVTVIQATI
jgi:hypothetical protein